MDWEEDGFDEETAEELVEELLNGRHQPTYRATIRGGRVWLRGWDSNMAQSCNLAGSRLPAKDVGVADLTLIAGQEPEGSRELIARWIYRSQAADDEAPLLDWAMRTGYARVWLPDRLVQLVIDPERMGEASVKCPTCGAAAAHGDPDFWGLVLKFGCFPDTCWVCGCAVPEWSPAEARLGEARRARFGKQYERSSRWRTGAAAARRA